MLLKDLQTDVRGKKIRLVLHLVRLPSTPLTGGVDTDRTQLWPTTPELFTR